MWVELSVDFGDNRFERDRRVDGMVNASSANSRPVIVETDPFNRKVTAMWKTGLVCSVLLLVLSGRLAAAEPQRSSEPLGDSISRGVRQVESKLRETWAEIQRGTQRMTVEARVYARLYWDKSLVNATLAIEGRDDGVVVLKGSVPSVAAQQRDGRIGPIDRWRQQGDRPVGRRSGPAGGGKIDFAAT